MRWLPQARGKRRTVGLCDATPAPIATSVVFVWCATVTCVLFLMPLIAMQFTDGVRWSLGDFVLAGALPCVAGAVFVFVARRVSRRHRLCVGLLIAVALLYVWAELAVGVFTTLGS